MKYKKNLSTILAAAMTLALSAQTYERPTMGWSSWKTYRVNISADLIMKQADAIAIGNCLFILLASLTDWNKITITK